MKRFSFFSSTFALILTVIATTICAYVAWQLGKLSKRVERGSDTLVTLSILLIIPAIILGFYILTQLNFFEQWFLLDVIDLVAGN